MFSPQSRPVGDSYNDCHLGNPLYSCTDEELTFIHPNDIELFKKWDDKANEVGTANHELLGHGSGKLFKEDADGKKNFDPSKVCFAPSKYLLSCVKIVVF